MGKTFFSGVKPFTYQYHLLIGPQSSVGPITYLFAGDTQWQVLYGSSALLAL